MPTKFIPVSEDEQKFGALVERIFNDQAFAKSMQSHPAQALQQAGYHLTPAQSEALAHAKPHAVSTNPQELAIPLTRPLVSVITKGTRPVVTIVTKGTQPVVSVAINSVVVAAEAAPTTLMSQEEVAKHKEGGGSHH